MALFKISKGLKANLPSAKIEGYCWYTTDDSLFYIDYKDENGTLQRKALNAKDAETLTGASLSTILNSSDVEIPTSKAVLNALNEKLDKADAGSDWNQNDETKPDYVKNRPFYTGDPVEMVTVEDSSVSFALSGGIYSATFPTSFNAEFGKTYKVSWDGIVYECTCAITNNCPVIGNQSIIGVGPDTGEPFMIFNEHGLNKTGWVSITTDTSASHTISIREFGTPVIKIDEKYIPELPFMDKVNPTGTGSFSLNRKADTTIGEYSFAEGDNTTASGSSSHAEGDNTTASDSSSHAEGYNTTASSLSSHAEGGSTTASGPYSHAEGGRTTASGLSSHAEGGSTTASGSSSHAEGDNTTAYGNFSHAEGCGTSAQSQSQHVQGEYNVLDTDMQARRGQYAHIVGNGTSDTARSNAHTLDWSGNAWYAGKVSIGTTSNVPTPTDVNDLVTKQYVDNKFSTKTASVTLAADSWTGTESPYSQVVTIDGVTANSKVDLNPTGEQLNSIATNRTILNTANDNGAVTVYAVGNKPTENYTMQVTITEV